MFLWPPLRATKERRYEYGSTPHSMEAWFGGSFLFQNTLYMGDQVADSHRPRVPNDFRRFPSHGAAEFTFQFKREREPVHAVPQREDIQRAGVAVIAPDEERIDQTDSGDRASNRQRDFRGRGARFEPAFAEELVVGLPRSSGAKLIDLRVRRLEHTRCGVEL